MQLKKVGGKRGEYRNFTGFGLRIQFPDLILVRNNEKERDANVGKQKNVLEIFISSFSSPSLHLLCFTSRPIAEYVSSNLINYVFLFIIVLLDRILY